MAAVGERQITYDARGLAEPVAEAPRIAVVEDGVATFDAKELTTRTINLELRRLVYEEGVKEVVIQNPAGRHSLGVGILTRCKITFEGSLGYFACGIIDGPEVHIKGRVGWSACENMMSGVVDRRRQRRLAHRRRAARRRPRDQGPRRRPHRASTRRAARSSCSATPAR